MVKIGIYTLGCRVNQYESSAIAEKLKTLGFDVSSAQSGCDYYIVNTCAVTAESERKSRQIIRRLAEKGRVAVIGCASQLHAGLIGENNIIFIGGCREKQAVVDAIIKDSAEHLTSPIDAVCSMQGCGYEPMSVSYMGGLFSECRAYLKIQDGCNGKCSYCIIPACRGSVRSRPFDEVIAESERLAASGYKEIILTGIEVSAYNKAPLSEIISALSDIKGLERVRFGSLSPLIINESFLKAARDSKNFMPHLHLSLQSLNDRVLKDMRRPYRKADVYDRVGLIRRFIPNCMLSADIIVGFPGETEEEYLETERAVGELGLFHVHSFPYSEREGTLAATMPGSVPVHIRRERNNRLIEESGRVKARIMRSMTGENKKVLIEKIKKGYACGHTEEYIEACFKDDSYKVGDIVDITVSGYDGEILKGETT